MLGGVPPRRQTLKIPPSHSMTRQLALQSDRRFGPFCIQHSQVIEDLGCTLTLARHMPSGARVLHIGNDDSENLFCLSLATPPPDATGVPHILEHCALCGSERYPVKDPFFSMSRRSLNTFMNAFTGADFTCYPAASQVPEDFYNLLDVYCDAVFHPLLLETSFWQEGIRLERVPPPGRGLQFGGIVFNEMKGILAGGERRLWSHLIGQLFPDTPYRYESGGHPDHIPRLTHGELRDYHSHHYHPSRCLFYFYGDLSLESHLNYLQERVLAGVAPQKPLEVASRQARREHPTYLSSRYPSGEDMRASGALFGLAWYVCDLVDRRALWLLGLLDELLLGSDAAPLKRSLLDRGLCKQVQSLLDGEIPQVPYALLLKGCAASDPKDLERAILKSLEEIAKRGFSREHIEGALHRLELQHLEIESQQNPYGLTLFWRSALIHQHGADPLEGLSVHRHFQELRAYLAEPARLSAELARLLIDNRHRTSALLEPDNKMALREQASEDRRLTERFQKLSEGELQKLDRQMRVLASSQEQREDLNCLPSVSIESISRSPKSFSLQTERFGSGHSHAHHALTNGFIYLDLLLPLPSLMCERPFERVSSPHLDQTALLRLLALFLARVGARDRDFASNASAIAASTGGIGADIANFAPADGGPTASFLRVRGKGLRRKVRELVTLLGEIACQANFSDEPRLRELLAQHCVDLEHSLTHNTLHYALLAACGEQSPSARCMSRWQGLEYVRSLRALWQKVQTDKSSLRELLIDPLQSLLAQIAPPRHLIVSCAEVDWRTLRENRFFGLEERFSESELAQPIKRSHQPTGGGVASSCAPSQRAFAVPSQVASNALSARGCCFAHPDTPLLQLAAHLLQHQTLHPGIREQGGAYSCGALARSDWQTFALYSSRDPNIAKTRKTFTRAIEKLSSRGCSQRELDEAKRIAIQGLDAPIAPGERGAVEFGRRLRSLNPELRAAQRERLLMAAPADVRACCRTRIEPQIKSASFVTAASDSMLDRQVAEIDREPI